MYRQDRPPGQPPAGPPSPPPPSPPSKRYPQDDGLGEEESDRQRRARELRRRHAEGTDPLERLKKLKEAYEAGLITKEEYEGKRAKIIEDI